MTEKRFEVVETMSDNNVAVKDMTDMTTHQMLDYGSALDVCILLNALNDENEQLKQENNKLHDTIFSLRTELAHQRTEKEKHSDSAYTFLKKLEKW